MSEFVLFVTKAILNFHKLLPRHVQKKLFQAKFSFTHCIVEYSKGNLSDMRRALAEWPWGFRTSLTRIVTPAFFFIPATTWVIITCLVYYFFHCTILGSNAFTVYCKEKKLLYEKTKKNLSCLRLHALKVDRLELSMLHLLSGIPNQLPVQLIPPSSDFPFSHRLSVSDVEGTMILKGERSEHLPSFPNTALPQP